MASLVYKLKSSDDPVIREMTLPFGDDRYAVYDAIQIFCGCSLNTATCTFARLISDSSKHRMEVLNSCMYLKFPGKGQRDTPTMSLPGLQRLLMILGEKATPEFRKIAKETYKKGMTVNDHTSKQKPKRTREELQIRKLELEIEKEEQDLQKRAIDLYDRICNNNNLDERAKKIFKDALLESDALKKK